MWQTFVLCTYQVRRIRYPFVDEEELERWNVASSYEEDWDPDRWSAHDTWSEAGTNQRLAPSPSQQPQVSLGHYAALDSHAALFPTLIKGVNVCLQQPVYCPAADIKPYTLQLPVVCRSFQTQPESW